MFPSNDHSYFSSVCLTKLAQEQLVKPLLRIRLPGLDDWIVRRYIASYAHVEDSDGKIRAIREIMRSLWRSNPGGSLLQVFEGLEGFMRAIGKRDHYVHQFEVFLLGWYIFSALMANWKISKLEIAQLNSIDLSVFFEIWLMTSMGHDIGYPLQETPVIIKELGRLSWHAKLRKMATYYGVLGDLVGIKDQGKHPLVQQLLNKEGKEIASYIISGVEQTLNVNPGDAKDICDTLAKSVNNHGYLSALLLGRAFLKYFKSVDRNALPGTSQDQKMGLYKLLLAATALHSLKNAHPDIIKKINFTANPLAYLLFIVDNLQEWSRVPGVKQGEVDPITYLKSINRPKSSRISLSFVTRHDYWGVPVVKRTNGEINKARQRLKWLKESGSNMRIKVDYQFNTDKIKNKIISISI